MRHALLLTALLALPFAVYACDDDDDSGETTGTNDGGTGSDAGTKDPATDSGDHTGHDAGNNPPQDAGPKPVRCTQAEFDQTAALPVGGDYTSFPGADISFPTSVAPAQYSPRCVKVKAGSKITFAGKFSFHPLEPNGGDTPTPIPTQTTDVAGDALEITVPTPGTYGFQCSFHATSMFGAIQVVP